MDLNDLQQQRAEKLARLRGAGIEGYPARTQRTHTINAVLNDFDGMMARGERVIVVGRVVGAMNEIASHSRRIADIVGIIDGIAAQGTQNGPTLIGVGAAAVHFQVATGRMPLANPGAQAVKEWVLLADSKLMDGTVLEDLLGQVAPITVHSALLPVTVPPHTVLVLKPVPPERARSDGYNNYKRVQ